MEGTDQPHMLTQDFSRHSLTSQDADYSYQNASATQNQQETGVHGAVSLSQDLMGNDPFGRWPRRLLHVKTMTSYCWKEGNVYGGVREPRYHAITYTWGRFAYRDSEKKEAGYSEATYLSVGGITWQDDMPRM